MRSKIKISDRVRAFLRPRPVTEGTRVKGHYKFVARRRDGSIKWIEETDNIIVNTGLDRVLSDVLKGGADNRITSWFIGLKNAGAPAATDTPSSHGGWTENQNYAEATREALVLGSVSSQSVDNSASPASFAINSDGQTIAGAFLVSNSTKGSTAGEFYSVGDFGSTKNLDDGETLEVTVTFTSADDGA